MTKNYDSTEQLEIFSGRDNILLHLLVKISRDSFIFKPQRVGYTDGEKPPWCSHLPSNPGVVRSIRGFSSLSDETLNRGPVSV